MPTTEREAERPLSTCLQSREERYPLAVRAVTRNAGARLSTRGSASGIAPSLDHLIRPQQQRRRDRQAEGLGGLEVDDQLELRGLLDREARRASPP